MKNIISRTVRKGVAVAKKGAQVARKGAQIIAKGKNIVQKITKIKPLLKPGYRAKRITPVMRAGMRPVKRANN